MSAHRDVAVAAGDARQRACASLRPLLAIAALVVRERRHRDAGRADRRGSKDRCRRSSDLGGSGWFTADLEQSLLDGRADIGVHSAKDLPSALARRADRRGVSAARRSARRCRVAGWPDRPRCPARGRNVGTSSARRVGLLAALYPAFRAVAIRGNVDTRIRKLEAATVDALVLACAGLDRLGLGERCTERLDPIAFVPAPAQGAIALEAVTGSAAAPRCAAVADASTAIAVIAERAVLAGLGGGCLLPLGAWARSRKDVSSSLPRSLWMQRSARRGVRQPR